jgi:hypothetical protein
MIGRAHLRISYGRPALRGRNVFVHGVLGDTVWRTGANAPTLLSTDHDLAIGGKVLPTGQYTLWTRVASDNSSYALVFSSQSGRTCLDYRPQFDVLEVPLRTDSMPSPLERLTITVAPVRDGEGRLLVQWGGTQLSVAVAAPSSERM